MVTKFGAFYLVSIAKMSSQVAFNRNSCDWTDYYVSHVSGSMVGVEGKTKVRSAGIGIMCGKKCPEHCCDAECAERFPQGDGVCVDTVSHLRLCQCHYPCLLSQYRSMHIYIYSLPLCRGVTSSYMS